MSGRASYRIRLTMALAGGLLLVFGGVHGWETYSTDGTTGNCASCHQRFPNQSYTSLADGQLWPDGLHTTHQNMVSFECDTCHSSGGRSPVFLSSSQGAPGLAPISCAGCHGRAEDATEPGMTEGSAAGLRQHHFVSGQQICSACHADANPDNKVTVAESTFPPYYGNASYPEIPTDPCNPEPGLPENYAGSTIGLDNDGDGVYDTLDSDCGAAPGTPGSVPMLLVQTHDPVLGMMGLSFGEACQATSNTLEYGLLSQVATPIYDGQECGLTGGSHDWSYPVGDSLFFLVVANNGEVEGSYGTARNSDLSLVERPEDATTQTCPLPQSLDERCDL